MIKMANAKNMPARDDRVARLANAATAAATAAALLIKYPYASFASGTTGIFDVQVDTDAVASKFSDTNAIASLVVGLALWICQLVGIGMLIWGIYGYVTARKDGEAEAMNGALGKLISGAVLIGMKGILAVLGIVG